MSSWSISRIPCTKIAFGGTCPPVASQTRIASLCAVSIPSDVERRVRLGEPGGLRLGEDLGGTASLPGHARKM